MLGFGCLGEFALAEWQPRDVAPAPQPTPQPGGGLFPSPQPRPHVSINARVRTGQHRQSVRARFQLGLLCSIRTSQADQSVAAGVQLSMDVKALVSQSQTAGFHGWLRMSAIIVARQASQEHALQCKMLIDARIDSGVVAETVNYSGEPLPHIFMVT